MFQERQKSNIGRGGKVNDPTAIELPKELNMVEFIESRVREMTAMERAARTIKGNSLQMQQVPRHMRRRAASHNVKRLPRRLRQAVLLQTNQPRGKPAAEMKRPSRRHRRRPSNLLKDYVRRQNKHVWLETHIWHAKRFHMADLWGYRVPLHPNDKGVRAAYRAMVHHCLIQDVSYMCCVELRGPQSDIVSTLGQLSSPQVGLSVAAKMYLAGTREGSTVLYKAGQYPFGAITPVKFTWKPTVLDNNTREHAGQGDPGRGDTGQGDTGQGDVDSQKDRQLWLWVHPASCAELLQEIKLVLKGDTQIVDETPQEDVQGKDTGSASLKDLHTGFTNPTFSNGHVTVTSLKDTLVRFTLTGPESNAILSDALQIADLEVRKSTDSVTKGSSRRWWEVFYVSGAAQEVNRKQRELWESLRGVQSPGQLPAHCVIGLTVRDPRLLIPDKKLRISEKPDEVVESTFDPAQVPLPVMSVSPIWQPSVRSEVKQMKLSEQELNRKRSKNLVPGTPLDLGDDECRVPVLLIQNPGRQSSLAASHGSGHNLLGCGNGWDLVLPGGWAMAFWVSLVYRGARAAGLREQDASLLEQSQLRFPADFPDTCAGEAMQQALHEQLEAKYNRIPPAKRPNYVKLGTAMPFHFSWAQLVAEWTQLGIPGKQESDVETDVEKQVVDEDGKQTFCVCRCRKMLRHVGSICQPTRCNAMKKNKMVVCSDGHTMRPSVERDYNINKLWFEPVMSRSLVAVQVSFCQRGKPMCFAMICMPTTADLATQRPGDCTEPLHKDTARKLANKRKRKHATMANVESVPNSDIATDRCQSVSVEGSKCGCWGECLVTGCTRQTIGYVTQANFVFSVGCGQGVGFVALAGLFAALQNQQKVAPPHRQQGTRVLVRSPQSLQYRWAHLSVLCDF